jgi:hypothetical protein
MLRFLLATLLLTQASQAALHPALTPEEAALTKAWKAGYARAKTDKTLYRAHKFAQRGIGRINGKSVSWVLFLHPRLLAFEQGFNARKDNATAESQANSLRGLSLLAQEGAKTLRFQVELGIYPRLGNGVAREAKIEDLYGVSASLRVGDRTYLPLQQPDNITPTVATAVHRWTEQIPSGTREVQHDDGSTTTETDYIEVSHDVKYTYFTSTFDLIFDLKNEDGTPRLTERDTEFTVLVKGRFGTQKATYRLQDWLHAYEK